MRDVWMILILAGMFALFYGFMAWCGRVVDEGEGVQK